MVEGSGTLTISSNAQLNIAGDGSRSLMVAMLQNLGTIRWTGSGSISVSSQRPVLQNDGLLEIQNDASIGNGGSGGFLILTNRGTVRKSVATGTSSFGSAQIVNQATLDLQSGSLWVGVGPLMQYAGTIRLGGGTLTVPEGVNIRSGILQGTGTVVANVTSAGSVEPGTPVGSLAITGIYTQEPAGAFTVRLAGAAPGSFGQLRVSGQAMLDGRLNARLTGGYSPGFGVRFACLSAAAIAGAFASYSSDPLPAGNFLTPEYRATGVDLVTLDATPEFVAARISPAGGLFTVRLKGIANQRYTIEAATDLAPPVVWTTLSTNIVPGSTFWDFVDTDSTNYACRFYRARHVPQQGST